MKTNVRLTLCLIVLAAVAAVPAFAQETESAVPEPVSYTHLTLPTTPYV